MEMVFSQGYARRGSQKTDSLSKDKLIHMHRVILSRKLRHSDFNQTDHKNQDRLDNRRSNLRPASVPQNQGNMKIRQGSSKFKGVCWDKNREKWLVRIGFEGKLKHLGRFTDEVEAAKTYNEAALEIFGKFACLNQI